MEHGVVSALSLVALAGIFLAIATAYVILIAVYRLFLHPLSRVPGPTYAAVTQWYQFYFDVIQRGKFPWELERMHKQYGPIVRIAPSEAHIADPEFYHVLYTSGSQRRHKGHFALDGFGLPDAVLETGDHDLHGIRRTALSPYFSTQAITSMEPVVHERLELLYEKLKLLEGTREPVNVEAAIMSMNTDIITQYCFGNSYDFLRKPHFSPEWARMIMGAAEMSNLGRYFPWLPIMMAKMPP